MNTALLALIIALLSLVWNIVSALHSWRTNMPKIKLDISSVFDRRGPILHVNVINKGGSPIAVTDINVWTMWPTIMDRLKRSYFRSGRNLKSFSKSKKDDPNGRDVDGPHLPLTIDGYHSQDWDFGASWISDIFRGKLLIEIELSTGKVVSRKVTIMRSWLY